VTKLIVRPPIPAPVGHAVAGCSGPTQDLREDKPAAEVRRGRLGIPVYRKAGKVHIAYQAAILVADV
jgi:hypothetical protein